MFYTAPVYLIFSMSSTFLGILEAEDRDWVGIRTLTGADASGFRKFQDSFYGNFNVGREPAMDTAWGRRVYDQHEIGYDVDKKKPSYLSDLKNSNMANFGHKAEIVERQRLRKTLGNYGLFISIPFDCKAYSKIIRNLKKFYVFTTMSQFIHIILP
jgi:hypothetical protein